MPVHVRLTGAEALHDYLLAHRPGTHDLLSLARQVATWTSPTEKLDGSALLLREPALSSQALLVLARAAAALTPSAVLDAFATHPNIAAVADQVRQALTRRHPRPDLVTAAFAGSSDQLAA